MNKLCRNPECKTPEAEQVFGKKSDSKDGLTTVCKICKATKDRIYREQNREKITKAKQEYRQNNKAKLAKTNQAYYQANKERIAEVTKQYRQVNKEELALKKSEYYKTKAGKLVSRAAWHKREALKKNNTDNTVTKESLETLMKTQNNSCFYCSCDLTLLKDNEAHLDHYIPLSKGGTHSIGNVVWSCPLCNLTKSNKVPDNPLIFPIEPISVSPPKGPN